MGKFDSDEDLEPFPLYLALGVSIWSLTILVKWITILHDYGFIWSRTLNL